MIALEAIQGAVDDPEAYIRSCMEQTGGTWRNGKYHAELLHKAADNIRLYRQVQNALDSLEAEELPTELIRIGQQAARGNLGKRRSMQELVSQLFDSFEKGQTKRIDTGFRKLDGLLMGMRPGNLVILAARPGVGKSAFAMQIAENVAKTGKKVIVYSMEMKGEELTERLIANHSGVPMDHIIERNFQDRDYTDMTSAASYLYSLPIIVNDESNVSPSKVRTEALEIGDAELIVVDYVGLMDSDGGKRAKENRNLELGAISRDLKKIATELEIPVLMLCQLNRAVDEDTKPELRHLRDSGELEQNANKIMFLWKLDAETQTVGVSVAKNRQGKTGIVQLNFDGEHMRFLEAIHDLPVPDYKKKRGRGFYDEE